MDPITRDTLLEQIRSQLEICASLDNSDTDDHGDHYSEGNGAGYSHDDSDGYSHHDSDGYSHGYSDDDTANNAPAAAHLAEALIAENGGVPNSMLASVAPLNPTAPDRPDEYDEYDEFDQPDEPDAPDLFTLLAELAALKNEVRLETRQVKAAFDQFSALFESLNANARRLQEELDRERERAATQRREEENPLLLELLELRDRLLAGNAQAQRYAPGWFARRGGAGDFVASMAEGMTMNVRHLDRLLVKRGVRPLEVLQRPFDPHTMRAMETAHDPNLPAGQVTAVLRDGFTRDGQLLRVADVIVNKGEHVA